MDKGIYTLILKSEGADIRIGALGTLAIPGGYLIYVGSALGPGGLGRISRHEKAAHDGRRPHWHIDYLLRHPSTRLIASVAAPTRERLECTLADAVAGTSIPGFGASDCRCRSHLFTRMDDPIPELADIFSSLGLLATIRRY